MKKLRSTGLVLALLMCLFVVLLKRKGPCSKQVNVDKNSVLRFNSEASHFVNNKISPLISKLGKNCQFPKVDPFNPEVVQVAVQDTDTLRCDLDFMPQIIFVDGQSLKIDKFKLDISIGRSNFSHCRYRHITRFPYDDNKIQFSAWSKPFTSSVLLKKDTEFVQAECYGTSPKDVLVSKSYFSLVYRRQHLEKLYDVRLKKRQVMFQPKETLSIVMLCLDGLSRHQFLRAMPKTRRYLSTTLKSFDFTMHGQVGPRTFPNLLSLFSGLSEEKAREWWNSAEPQDPFDLIFENFEKAGYRTLFSEDNPFDGAFYWVNKTFVFPQASYWNRPVHIAMKTDQGFVRRHGVCLGSRPVTEFQFDYLFHVLETLQGKPVFAFNHIDSVTHDDTDTAGMIDDHLFNYYKTFSDKGYLNNTLVILLSDHGQRWGKLRQSPNGLVDRRNPFMMLTFPPWFLSKYPDIAHNLDQNTRVLTSPFDTRQMLFDLLYFKSKEDPPFNKGKKGISLFDKIPDRTCDEAFIPETQCLCNRPVEKHINTSSPQAQEMSKKVFEAIKARSDGDLCQEFYASRTLRVVHLQPHGSTTKESHRSSAPDLFLVRIAAYPGGGIFEAKVFYDRVLHRYTIDEDIERLNMYKVEKIICLPEERQVFCFCKSDAKNLKLQIVK